MTETQNPLLVKYNTPFGSHPFDAIEISHYKPAFLEAMKIAKKEVEEIIASTDEPTFKNTIEAMERSGETISRVSSVFFNLHSAETNPEMQALAQEMSPLLTAHSNDILLNEQLFEKIKFVNENTDKATLNTEQQMLLDKTYKSFLRNGANLSSEDKKQYREISTELAQLSLLFGENVLAANNAFELRIVNSEELEGLPEYAIQAAAAAAVERGYFGEWLLTLDYPSYMPVITYAKNRELRKKMFLAFGSKCFIEPEQNNENTLQKIAKLRFDKANLLGYSTHASLVLEERMAKTPEKVFQFLEELKVNALPFAIKELQALKDLARSEDNLSDFEKWDLAYYAERLKKQKFDIDDNLLKPYFVLENVLMGAFYVAEKLFGLTFRLLENIAVYHADVRVYEVLNAQGQHQALFYADFFPRPGKRQGAWMTSFRGQHLRENHNQRPHVSIVCNFTKPIGETPSLLTFNEVTTLFHEFGHALHGMCANTEYESLSGTSVYWDFVELPSQMLENWCYEEDVLKIFAKHYQTQEIIPLDYVEKIRKSANFNSGFATIRQIGLGLIDMQWHHKCTNFDAPVKTVEMEATRATELLNDAPETCTSTQFSHIFQGGYASGYYSYKWAEVLDADAFESFKQEGVLNQATGQRFLDNILSKGGSNHPEVLYRNFKGKEPSVDALLRRSGLVY